MEPSDLPDSAWDPDPFPDDDYVPQKHAPNSWLIKHVAAHAHQESLDIPPPDPLVPWTLNHNDLLFLKRLGIRAE